MRQPIPITSGGLRFGSSNSASVSTSFQGRIWRCCHRRSQPPVRPRFQYIPLALQAPGQFLADALQGRDSRARLKDADSDGRLVGSAEDEVLIGGNVGEILEGGDGADEIRGNGGDDILDGQADSDFLLGGLGSDTYLFGLGSGIDVINERGDNKGRRHSEVRTRHHPGRPVIRAPGQYGSHDQLA